MTAKTHKANDGRDDVIVDEDAGTIEVVDAEPVVEGKSTELAVVEPVPNPKTGEAYVLAESSTEQLAELRDAFVIYGHELRALQRRLDFEIATRADHEGTRTFNLEQYKVTVQAPTSTVWDGPELYRRFRELVRGGILSDAAAKRAVRRVTDYATTHGELIKLERHADERVRAAVAAGKSTEDVVTRRVTVTPTGKGRA